MVLRRCGWLSLKGSLAQIGQSVPVKSIKFVNNTVPAGSATILQSEFINGNASPFEPNTTFYYNTSYAEPLTHWTATGGDEIDIEIEFDNDVIGVIYPATGSIMTAMVG